MAKLVNKPQAIRVGVKYPNPGYSRVVSCQAFIKSPDHRSFGITLPLGGSVRLLSVRVWFAPHKFSSTESVRFYVFHGQGIPTDADELLAWDNVLPIMFLGRPGAAWQATEDFHPFEWTMNQLFTGKVHRFGLWVDVGGVVPVLTMAASFQISEG